MRVELLSGGFLPAFPRFERMAKAAGLSEQRLGRRNIIFSPFGKKDCLYAPESYTGFSDRWMGKHLKRATYTTDVLQES